MGIRKPGIMGIDCDDCVGHPTHLGSCIFSWLFLLLLVSVSLTL